MSLVSVVIPLFNREDLIGETLQCLIDQSHQEWEAVVVDDGSTDKSREVVAEFTKIDHRITLFTRDGVTKGAQACRNIGLQRANGEYVIFLDSDDLLSKECLANRVESFVQYPDYDFLVFRGLQFRFKPTDTNVLISSFVEGDPFPYFIRFDIPWITLNPMYKRKQLLKYGVTWDEKILGFQDVQFHLAVLSSGMTYKVVVGIPDCFWRVHEQGNIGADLFKNRERVISHIYFVRAVYSYLKRCNQITSENILCLNRFVFRIIDTAIRLQEYRLHKEAVELFKELDLLSGKMPFVKLKILFIGKFLVARLNHLMNLYIRDKIRIVLENGEPNRYFLVEKF
jgi:glycosyltransferase involved in cell wall biosynthesis